MVLYDFFLQAKTFKLIVLNSKKKEMENPKVKVKKRCLGLNDVFEDEECSIAIIPSPPPSMVVPMERSLKGKYLVRTYAIYNYTI
jgi:hypothetical protein